VGFQLASGGALRVSEALRLTWADIDFERKLIAVPGSKTGGKQGVDSVCCLRSLTSSGLTAKLQGQRGLRSHRSGRP